MAYTLRRSVKAMSVTSLTTFAAMMANYFSPMMTIKAFGVFAGIDVPINFLLTIVLFPSATILTEKWAKECGCCCYKQCCEVKESDWKVKQEEDYN